VTSKPTVVASPQTRNWGELTWSRWWQLDRAISENRVRGPGIYRFRSRGDPGLLYIGESGARPRRLGGLLKDLVYPVDFRHRRNHTASRSIRRCLDAGCRVEVSWTLADELLAWRPERKDTERDLMQQHADELGWTPPCQQLGRDLPAWLAKRVERRNVG
jgi:hypothetical protein